MKQLTKRLLSLVLVLLMLVNTTALAADSTAAPSQELFFTQTEGSGTPDPGAWADADDAEGAALYADTDIVRVSIVLKKASTWRRVTPSAASAAIPRLPATAWGWSGSRPPWRTASPARC